MSLNRRCPRCGSRRVMLTNEENKHGCLWTIFFGIYYICWVFFKWILGILVFIMYDWWMAIIKALMGRGHVWVSGKLFSGKRRFYYCLDCSNNFSA